MTTCHIACEGKSATLFLAPASCLCASTTARSCTAAPTSTRSSEVTTPNTNSFPSLPLYVASAVTRASPGVGAVCETSTVTPTDSWPGSSYGLSTWAVATSIRTTRREVAKTEGKSSWGSVDMVLARSVGLTRKLAEEDVPTLRVDVAILKVENERMKYRCMMLYEVYGGGEVRRCL